MRKIGLDRSVDVDRPLPIACLQRVAMVTLLMHQHLTAVGIMRGGSVAEWSACWTHAQ